MHRVVTFLIRGVAPILVIVFMMIWLGGAFRKGRIEGGKVEAAVTPATSGMTLVVEMTRLPEIAEAAGAVQPEFKSTVSARVVANVAGMHVRAGQHVAKGTLLVRLDDRDLEARLSQARVGLRHAEANRDLAGSDFRRDKPLAEAAVIPAADFDQTSQRLKTAVAEADRASEAVREAEIQLGYASIYSPYDGVVIDRLAEVGDLAAPGKPLLTMYDPARLWFEASVSEEDAELLSAGQRYAVRIGPTGKAFIAPLAEIVPASDPASRTVTARFRLTAGKDFYPGMFGRVSLPKGETQAILIPVNCLIRVGQMEMVDVVQSGVPTRRSVQTGRRFGDKIEILSGIVPGERVVVPNTGSSRP